MPKTKATKPHRDGGSNDAYELFKIHNDLSHMVNNLTQRATTKQIRSVCSEAQHVETGTFLRLMDRVQTARN